ncbi:MAG: sugar ABC transporter permease [Firmicutes bacterium]|nr:sugar ABC transporter permease [Bacillota bacterium]
MTARMQRTLLIVSFLFIPMTLHTVFFAYPVLSAFRVVLYKWSGLSWEMTYIGLRNFLQLLSDPVFPLALRHNLTLLLVAGPIVYFLALFILFLLNLPWVKGRRGFISIFYFPAIISEVAVALVWVFIYNPQFGLLNGILRAVGLGAYQRAWLGESRLAFPSMMGIVIWGGLGGLILYLQAGLQRIPTSLYEAAKIDGAGNLQIFLKITLPLLWEILRILIVLSVIGYLQAFGIFFVAKELAVGIDLNTVVLGTYIYYQAFQNFNFGYATAIAMVVMVIVMAATILSRRFTSGESVEI